jgi:hypothetical protein
MSAPVVELLGTLRDDGTVLLDTKPDLPPGRVRVTVQPVAAPPDVMDVLRRIHAEQAASGHVPRSGAEIDADIAAMRQEDEERMRQIERLHEEFQRGGEEGQSPGER